MSFLRAEWRKLLMVNYSVDPDLLRSFVPAGTELDLWDGKCYISLVGFMFLNTRLLGLPIPWHIDFEEVNLRFYVRRFDRGEWKRGVVFIRELVPKPALALVANVIFRENYQVVPMTHLWQEESDCRTVTYSWKLGSQWQTMHVRADLETSVVEKGSEEEFITEHYWGYARIDDRRSNEYEVTHLPWRHFKIHSYNIDVDFESTYGGAFAGLTGSKPSSVMLSEGSGITVELGRRIFPSD